jgi:predicted NAD/FAD-binding protein
MMQRICVVGAGISGLGAAWALRQHPDLYDVEVFEKAERIGGNATTVDISQADGSSIPVDISVTAFIPSVYHNFVSLLAWYGVEQVPTRFSYAVHYDGDVYAHDVDSPLKARLRGDIERFQRNIRVVKRLTAASRQPSILASVANPLNYVSMRRLLDLWGLSSDFRVKVLKPMFVNFVLATNVFDMPAGMFSRYLDFFDVERSTPMVTWRGGTRAIYERMTGDFGDRIHLRRAVERVVRDPRGVTVVDGQGRAERFDHVVLACNANQALMLLDRPSGLERYVLGSVRYESELHNHAVVHTDGSVLPVDELRIGQTRSNFLLHYGSRPDNYEITYIMHNQQPWAAGSDRPCLVTYNPVQPIDPQKVVARAWFQHVVHDVFHTVVLLNLFPLLQGRRRTWYCGAHTVVNSQEHCFVSGLTVARQLGADYPFGVDPEAARWFNFYGRLMHGPRFRTA